MNVANGGRTMCAVDYWILIFLYGVGIVLFAVGWDKGDQSTIYVGHTAVGFASVLAIGMGLGFGVPLQDVGRERTVADT